MYWGASPSCSYDLESRIVTLFGRWSWLVWVKIAKGAWFRIQAGTMRSTWYLYPKRRQSHTGSEERAESRLVMHLPGDKRNSEEARKGSSLELSEALGPACSSTLNICPSELAEGIFICFKPSVCWWCFTEALGSSYPLCVGSWHLLGLNTEHSTALLEFGL